MIFSIDKLPQVIPIGIQTESGVGEICFDVKPWVDAFGSMTLSVWLTRPGDSAAYPAENVKLDGNILCWTPNEVDTAISGMGRVEILGFAEGKRKLSGYCDTIIQGTSLSATQDPPDGLRYWVDKVVEAGEQAMAAVDKMPTISEKGTWMLWDPVVKVYADSGLPSRGKAGDKGDNGVGIQSVTQTTTSTEDGGENIVTVTKTDGSKSTFAVMNGRKGKDGTGVTILGSYESVDELKAAHPTGNAGDAYLIDGYLYVWSVNDSAWKNVGKIQGPQGEPGIPGATGPAGSDGRDGISVTITNVSTSSEDGGSNVVTFSDGKTMTVKNGSKGKDGKDGKDGTGVTILGSYESEDALKAAHPTGNAGDAYLIDGYLYVWSASDNAWKNVGKIQGPAGERGPAGEPGSPGATGPAGPAGSDGAPGKDGTSVTITNVSTSSEDGGSNVVTFSDGKTMTVKNGSKGSTGATGPAGPAGPAGSDGAPGHTPVKGTDYFTAADKQDIVNDALSALAGADPSDAGYAELKGRTSRLEIKTTNIAVDIATIQKEVNDLTTSFIILHHPLPAPEDLDKMSFVYTSWMSYGDDSEWYDDITLMSPTGDVYAGRMIDNDPDQYVREKLATEKYADNVQMDWNVPAGYKGHILNRTHYDVDYEDIAYDGTPEYRGGNDKLNGFLVNRVTIPDLKVGKEYTIIINGTEYKYVAEPDADGYFRINLDSGKYFILYNPGGGIEVEVYDKSVTTLNLKIFIPIKEFKKLDSKFIDTDNLVLTAPNGNKFRLTVDNNGNLGTVAVN